MPSQIEQRCFIGMKEEPFVDFPGGRAAVAPLTHLRSTLLGASILALKHRGHYETYLTHLPEARRDEILLAVAGQWLPIELGELHYNACDAMGLPEDEIIEIGKSVSNLANGTTFSITMRLAQQGAVTPWLALGKGPTAWARSYRGSGFGVFKLGPKDARVDVLRSSLAGIGYWRTSCLGIFTVLTESFCTKADVRMVPWRASDPYSVSYRLSWV